MESTDVWILTPFVFPGVAMTAALAARSNPVQVIETLDPAGITVPTPTLIATVGGENDEVETPDGNPHMLLA